MINIVAGSRDQPLYAVLGDADGVIDLTGKTVSAFFRRAGRKATTLFEQTCTIDDATNGQVSMPWPADWEDLLAATDGTALRSCTNCEVQYEITTTATAVQSATVNVSKIKVHPKFADV